MKPSTQQAVLSINVGTALTHMSDRSRPENTPITAMGTLKEKPSKLLQETHAGDQRSLNRAHGTRHPRQGPSPGLYTLYKFRQHRNSTSTTLNKREGQADSTHTSLSP